MVTVPDFGRFCHRVIVILSDKHCNTFQQCLRILLTCLRFRISGQSLLILTHIVYHVGPVVVFQCVGDVQIWIVFIPVEPRVGGDFGLDPGGNCIK